MAVLSGLLPLLVLGAVAYGVVRVVAAQRHPGGPGGGGGGAGVGAGGDGDLRDQVVRLFRLGLLFVALVLATEGIAGLLAEVLPRPGELARDPGALAQALSFTIVGAPALVGLARWTRHRLAVDPDEAPSPIWALYLGGTLVVALLVTLSNVQQTLGWVVGAEPFDGPSLARTVVWGAVLGAHWELNRRRPLVDLNGAVEARTPWYVLAGSLIGLAAGSSALAELVRVSLRLLYDSAFSHVLIADGPGVMGRALASALPGVAIWAWFWLGHGLRAPRTERWYGYGLLAGVLGGLVATLLATGQIVFSVLQWWFGDPTARTAAAHFTSLPGHVAALAIGGGVWVHHRRTLATARRHRFEVDRIYTYLVAFVGVVVCTVAVTLVVAAFVEAVVGTGLAGSVADPVVLAVTFLLIGFPVWLVFWRRAEANTTIDSETEGGAEIRSPSRRLYLLVTLGLSAAVALVSLVVLLTGFLTDLTAGELAADTLRRIRVPLGLVLSTAAVAGYHGVVYRDDRRSAPPPPPPERRVREVVLISDLAPADAASVAGGLGGRVIRYTTANGTGPRPDDEALARAAEATAALAANRALVTVRGGTIEVEALQD